MSVPGFGLTLVHHVMAATSAAAEAKLRAKRSCRVGDDPDAAAVLMRPAPNDVLRAWPISRAVNDVRRDGSELAEPVE